VRIYLLSLGLVTFACSSSPATRSEAGNDVSRLSQSVGTAAVTTAVRSKPIQVLSVSSGGSHTCATLSHHETRCWGYNESGELGLGTMDSATVYPPSTTIPGFPTAKFLSAGSSATCGLSQDGLVECWGANYEGNLGIGDSPSTYQLTPAPVTLPALAKQIFTNNFGLTSCAIVQGADVYCWGANESGQLGIGTLTSTSAPTSAVPLGRNAISLAVGNSFTCALLRNGQVKCWGSDTGNNSGPASQPGNPVALPSKAISISAGTAHTCVVLDTGDVYCWGNNADGEVGVGDTTNFNVPLPQQVIDLAGPAVSVSCGSDDTCAVLADGRVECWGNNFTGQLGTGDGVFSYAAPVLIDVGFPVDSIASGFFHRCALSTTGDLKCWGYNGGNMLGLQCGADCPDTSLLTPAQLANIQF